MTTYKLFIDNTTNRLFISDRKRHYRCSTLVEFTANSWIDAKQKLGLDLSLAQQKLLAAQ